MSNKGERLIAALEANPDLLFEVVVHFKGAKVAGPWTADGDNQYKRVRRSLDGKLLAVVNKHKTRNVNPWEASVNKLAGSEERPRLNHMQQGQALDWCDMRLLEQGYMLCEGE